MDRRRVPARSDIAAEHLRGTVESDNFIEGVEMQVNAAVLNLTLTADPAADLATQLLMGERFTAYKQVTEMGLTWGQSGTDGYVGFVATQGLVEATDTARLTVTAVSSMIYEAADIKSTAIGACSYGCQLVVDPTENGFHKIERWGYIPAICFAAQSGDFVDVAERFLHTPYLWGGRSAYGLDCSALVQLSMQGAGLQAPRDTDMQMAELGLDAGEGNLQRGDLVFWDGHVGIMLDEATILHANAHHMAVVSEPLSNAKNRIAKAGEGSVISVRRLQV